jgi:hypothetical protein
MGSPELEVLNAKIGISWARGFKGSGGRLFQLLQ